MVLVLHVELVQGVVDLLDVERLRLEQVLLDERHVAGLAQLRDDAHVVDALRDDVEHLVEEEGLLLQVEVEDRKSTRLNSSH